MNFRVIIEERAAADIAAYATWIADQGSPGNASRWIDGIEDAIESLALMPERCPLTFESEVFRRPIRQHLYKSHRVLFTIEQSTVHVLHVRHGAQDHLASRDSTA